MIIPRNMINLILFLFLVFCPFSCIGGGGASVFSRDNIELVATSFSILGCIVFTLLMELALTKLEHIAKLDKAKHAFVHKMYEEMITLGFFSFGLILLIDFNVFDGPDKQAGLLKFELAHLWLFMFGMFMVLQNLVGFMVIHGIEKRWIRCDHLGIKSIIEQVPKDWKPRPACLLAFFGGGKNYELMEYEAMKEIFLVKNKIKSEKEFRFAKYLQRATAESISEHLEHISYLKWFLLIVVGVAYIALIDHWNHTGTPNNEDLWFSLAYSFLLGIVSILLMVMARSAKVNLIKQRANAGESSDLEEKNDSVKPCPPKDYLTLMSSVSKKRAERREQRLKEVRAKGYEGGHTKRASSPRASHGKHGGHGGHGGHGHGGHGHGHGHGKHEIIDPSGKTKTNCCGKLSMMDAEDILISQKKGLLPCKLKMSHMMWMNDMVVLLQCFYLGLFVTLLWNIAVNDFGALKGALYILAILCEQFLVMLWTGPSLVKDVVLIQSMLYPNDDIKEEVKDEVEELLEIRKTIIAAIEEEFQDSCNRELELRKSYRELDSDGSGTLGSKELKAMLAKKLKTKLHGRQCDLIIEEMDKDLSGEVDFAEFMEFLEDPDKEHGEH